jgi:lipoprotein NlpI
LRSNTTRPIAEFEFEGFHDLALRFQEIHLKEKMMMRRIPVLALGVGLALLFGKPLSAQVSEANANPAHEKIKAEAENFYKQGNYPKTIELTTQVLDQNKKDDVAFYLRGSAKVEQGLRTNNTDLVRQGIADAREAISLNGQKKMDYYLPYLYGMSSLSQLESRKEHAEVGIQVASQVLNLTQINEDQKANVLYQRARANAILGKHADAAKDYEQALRFNSMHMGAYLGAAHAYANAGDAAKAERQFNQAIQAFPNQPIVYNDRGMYHQQRKEFDKANADFTRVIELKKDAYYAYTNRGFTLMEQGDHEAAENDFDRSLALQPNQAMVHSFRGTARLAQGKIAEATADYQKVVQLDSANPVAKADLGFALFFAENYAGAAQQFAAATKADGELKHLHPWHYVSLKRSQPQANVTQQFTEVLETDPEKSDWADHVLGYLLGRIAEAQLLETTKGDDAETSKAQACEAHFFIGQKKAIEGNQQEAIAHFKKSMETNVSHLSAYRGSEMALKRLNVAITPSPGRN